jgi:hypothetical protein
LGIEKEAGGDGVFSRATRSSEQKAFIGVSSAQDSCSTKGEMGKVSFATKSRSLIPALLSRKRLLPEYPT